MKHFLFTFLLFSIISGRAQDAQNGIRFFEGTWQQAMEAAQKEGKPVFLDCYTTWCPPCAYLAKEIFPQKQFGDVYNDRFINVKMNMETEEGKQLAKQYEVSAYPTLLLINDRGYKMAEMMPVKKPDSLLQWPLLFWERRNSLTDEERFDKGDRTDSLTIRYSNALIAGKKPGRAATVVAETMKARGETILLQPAYFSLLPLLPVESVPVAYFVKNRMAFEQRFGKQEVAAKLVEMHTTLRELSAFYQHGPPRHFLPEQYKVFLQKTESKNLPEQPYILAKTRLYVAFRNGDMANGFAAADAFLKPCEQAWQLLDMADLANSLLREKDRLKAARWAERAALLSRDTTEQLAALQTAHDLLALPFIPLEPSLF